LVISVKYQVQEQVMQAASQDRFISQHDFPDLRVALTIHDGARK
jgi:hypothetical protein